MKKKYLSIVFLFLVLFACILSTDQSVKVMKNIFHTRKISEDKDQLVIVIDPGHGGRDPGKIGVNDTEEKNLNLSIAFKLKSLLEQNDIKVIMTREEDIGLYSDSDSNKKRADLLKRAEIIQSANADLAISIHQNSYSEEYVRGAQTFYYSNSEQGKKLAETILEQLKNTLKDGNHRMAKSNDNYYMLKKSACTLVIVECGYMSNYSEADLLTKDDYQEKLAWGIHLGIMRFINSEGLE